MGKSDDIAKLEASSYEIKKNLNALNTEKNPVVKNMFIVQLLGEQVKFNDLLLKFIKNNK